MIIAILVVIILTVIIGGAYTRSRNNRNIHLIADKVIGMTVAKGTKFIKDCGCRYVVEQNNNMSRILPATHKRNRIKIYIRRGMIINATVG